MSALIDDSPDIFVVLDGSDRVTFRSMSADGLLGPDAVTADDIVALADDGDQPAIRALLTRADADERSDVFRLTGPTGDTGWYELRVSDLSHDPLIDGRVITALDITDEVDLRDELQRRANTDVLTGLPNRRVLPDALHDAAHAIRRGTGKMALLTIDIDGFKVVNDTLGHLAGDELLTCVAQRLSEASSPTSVVLRLGGDEFAVVMSDVASTARAVAAAERLLRVLGAPIRLGDRDEHGSASIGVAVTEDPDHADRLLGEADLAMYAAKRQGGSTVVLFEPELAATASRATRITHGLRSADLDEEFSLVYQPIVATVGSEIVGLEALLRWDNPELGSVRPDELIPLAEASGEICRIGKWVLEQVCQQIATWMELGLDPGIAVSINVSPRQLTEDDCVQQLLAIANTWSVPPSRLVVEVTESVALEHSGPASMRLEQLRQAGLRISIDDFGSGYSNLGQLLQVPFDVIKIDRSLLLTLSAMREQHGGDTSGPCAIMEAIVSIAGILDAPVGCEGVETEQQLRSLRASGIRYVQGYLTGRPADAEMVTRQLRAAGALRPETPPPVIDTSAHTLVAAAPLMPAAAVRPSDSI